MSFDDQQSIDIRPHPNNHFVPGITIREIFESGRFRTYVDGNAHFVHVYTFWGRLPICAVNEHNISPHSSGE